MLECWFCNVNLNVIAQQDTENALYEVRQCPKCGAFVEIYYYDQENSEECEDENEDEN